MSLHTFPDLPPGKSGWPWTETPTPLPGALPDGAAWPKISVITPSFNQGQFIEETIRSVLLQGYPNLEYIIIDGGSRDNTLEIIKKYEPWLAYWVSEPDRGQSHAVNKGIDKATGEILLWLNSDDILLPGALDIIVKEFQKITEPSIVIGQAKIIDVQGNFIGELESKFTSWEDLVVSPNNSIRQISSFFSRECFELHGLLNEKLQISMDTELLTRFIQTCTPKIIPGFVSAFRSQPLAKSAVDLLRGYKETDTDRQKILTGSPLLHRYKENSANHWISISKNKNFSLRERLDALLQSVKIYPKVLLTRRFWSSVVKVIQT